MAVCSNKNPIAVIFICCKSLHLGQNQISDSQNTVLQNNLCSGTYQLCLDQEPKMLLDFPLND